MVMPLSKPDPQGYGSALTYARRYSLASMVGLISEDDDGETACGRSSKGNNQTQKCQQSKSNDPLTTKPGNGQSNGSLGQDDLALLSNLPRLNGVSYQSVKANDGKVCVVPVVGTAAGGIVGCLAGALAGFVTGTKLGEKVDKHVIKVYKCVKCGWTKCGWTKRA
jgi:hypothetical protein